MLVTDLKTQKEYNGYEFLIIKQKNVPTQLARAETCSFNSAIFLQTAIIGMNKSLAGQELLKLRVKALFLLKFVMGLSMGIAQLGHIKSPSAFKRGHLYANRRAPCQQQTDSPASWSLTDSQSQSSCFREAQLLRQDGPLQAVVDQCN